MGIENDNIDFDNDEDLSDGLDGDNNNVSRKVRGRSREKLFPIIPIVIKKHYEKAMSILITITQICYTSPELDEESVKAIRELKPLCDGCGLSNTIIAIDSLELICEGPDKIISEDTLEKFYRILLEAILSDFGVYNFIKANTKDLI
jgi:hypothetical protein